MIEKIKTSKKFPLIIEDHPNDYNGYPFITLIKYNDESFLTIVDNIYKKHISAYVLDLCAPQEVDELKIVNIANHWYSEHFNSYPISIEFSRRNMTEEVSKICRSYSIDYITRVIGPVRKFDMGNPSKIRKRKRKFSKNMEIINKSRYFKNIEDGIYK